MVNIERVGYKQLREYLVNQARAARLAELENDWDACFYAQGANWAGLIGIARHVVERFLSRQHDNGFIPQFKPSAIRTAKYPVFASQLHCKPFLAQTLVSDLRLSGNGCEYYQRFLPKIAAYLDYYDCHRRSSSGLYYWSSEFESGVNTNIEPMHLTGSHAESNYDVCKGAVQVLSVDLNSYLVMEFRAFAELLDSCGQVNEAAEYLEKAHQLQELICALMWNPELGLFSSISADGHQLSDLRSWTGWLPVVFGLASKPVEATVVRQNILSEDHFLCQFGLSSLSKADPLFSLSGQTVDRAWPVSNWYGPLWILPNVFAVRYLAKSPWREFAIQIARGVLDALRMDLEQNKTLHASYDPITGKPLAEPMFLSWNLLALELLALVEDSVRAA